MNPLTLVKRIQKINSTEANLGISDEASWHAKYKDSAYVFVGGVPFQLTEGDLLAVFSQYGEVVDVNLVRDKGTGKSKGFAFLAYEDQRSTVLAVDNLNGAKLLGRVVRVDHVGKYKKKQEEDDEDEANKKREARGVCYAFQRGECNRGDGCRFSHDPERNANTGGQDRRRNSMWEHDMQEPPPPPHRTTTNLSSPQHHASERSRETKTSFPFHNDGRSPRLRSDQDVDDDRITTRNKDHDGHPTHIDNSHRETRHNDNTDRDRQTRERHSSRSQAEADRLDDKERRTYEKRPRHDHDSSSDYQHRRETERERGRR